MDNNKFLLIPSEEVIFPEVWKRITLPNESIYRAYEQYFTTINTFVSGIFVIDGVYYGTLCKFVDFPKRKSGLPVLRCNGLSKVKITSFDRGADLFDLDFCTIDILPNFTIDEDDLEKIDDYIKMLNDKVIELSKTQSLRNTFLHCEQMTLTNAESWINRNSQLLDIEAQYELFLETDALLTITKMCDYLSLMKVNASLSDDLNEKVEEEITKEQQEYYLRSQLKIIYKELNGDEQEVYREKIEKLDAPQTVKNKLFREIEKISSLSSGSPEAYVATNYVDFVLSLPWGVYSEENDSIDNARKILEEDHYGIEEVKERVLEFLAVHKLVKENKGSILCFYGPPGTGKTSIVKSIARALNRKYVRTSLGGTGDEAEIRGHRRTYLGSMPGRIISSIKQSGTMNPVFLMDEIDKLGKDHKGDPASALLEVLDPEQNKGFVDNYMDMPFDLSNVLFIATANDISRISKPLLDRMELIEMSSYTTEEKEQIAIRYLIPKQIKANGLPENLIKFQKSAVDEIILNYTMEAGVRSLEKCIARICRKIAVKFGDKPIEKYTVTTSRLTELLGAPLSFTKQNRPDEVGVITGLAYTAYGGTTMDMEALLTAGKGELRLTGSLGDVMKESASQAHTLIKSRAKEYGIDEELFNKDLHINAVECAVPKDGPSAGIALTTVILSAYTGKKIRSDIALTGEISLSGRVLPIGGVKEKSMGAINKGIYKVVLPEQNRQDVERLPSAIKSRVEYIFVQTIDEVIKVMIIDEN